MSVVFTGAPYLVGIGKSSRLYIISGFCLKCVTHCLQKQTFLDCSVLINDNISFGIFSFMHQHDCGVVTWQSLNW